MGGEGKRKKGQKETGKEGEEKTTYISPHAMHTLAWLTTCSVNQLIPAIVDKKRAKKVAPLVWGMCVSVMPPQGTPCRATPDRNGCKARSAGWMDGPQTSFQEQLALVMGEGQGGNSIFRFGPLLVQGTQDLLIISGRVTATYAGRLLWLSQEVFGGVGEE